MKDSNLQHRIDAFLERKTAEHPDIDRYAAQITRTRD